MAFFCTAVCDAIGLWALETLGKRIALRPSQKAMLASSDFVRSDAKGAADLLRNRIERCRLYGAPLLQNVRAENGWLLFDLHAAAFDAYAARLPREFTHGTAYADRRMELLLRHGDAPTPDCPAILRATLNASFASRRGRWTKEEERAVLSMTHTLSGMERVRAEQCAAHAATIILYERSTMLCN